VKSIRFHEFGGPDVLRVDEIEKPQPGAGEVLIRVMVAGVNYADTMLRAGTYFFKPPLPHTPGFEVAGVIEAADEGVSGFKPGQRVMARVASGGYAEYAVAKTDQVMLVPEDLDFGKATAILVQGWTALGLLKSLRAGQTVLVHAAAGGVGSILVQLAKAKGARVIGTASTVEKLETVKSLGADVTVNYSETHWTEQVLASTEGKGVDLLIEMTGGEIGSQNIRCLAAGGTMIVYGAASGKDFQISAVALMSRNLTVKGYTLYSETPETLEAFTQELVSHLENGRLRIMVQEFSFAEAAEAHRAMEARRTTGKVVLNV
jgi:NADPH2:quinone reductase